jgi:ferrochelatase
MADRKLGVVLLNMGGPDSTADVPAYLLNIFHDPAILDMPLGFLVRPWLSRIIVRKRAAESAARYEKIGGKTPLNEIAQRQAQAIQEALEAQGVAAVVLPGMRYWHPFIEEAVRRFKDGGVTRVVALSMYPHYSGATTGSCMRELLRAMKRHLPGVPVATIDRWPGLPHYVDFLADNTARTLESLPRESRPRTAVLFSAHGVPVRLIEKGDPYRDQVEETCRLVCAKLPRDTRTALGWQSAFGPAKWLEPDSKTLAARFAKDGVENLIVVPLGFAAENIETLWDIEIDLKSFAAEQGIHRFLRMPCPNVELGVMCGLAALVGEAAEGKES